MKNTRLERVDAHLREKLKDKAFCRDFELERAKVALAQKIARLREEEHLRLLFREHKKLLNRRYFL